MRMWMVPPNILCNKHLVGEHAELHMFLGSFRKGINLNGYGDKNLMQLTCLEARHDALVIEMVFRGMKHRSPMYIPYDEKMFIHNAYGQYKVDVEASLQDLLNRCPDCRKRHQDFILSGGKS